MPWSLRPAVPSDASRLGALMIEGFEGYRSFAPPGWEPPDVGQELKPFAERLGDPEVWCLVAEQEGEVVGHVAFMPARIHSRPSDEPGLAHFWQLFVREPWWGTGLATALHTEAVREAASRGFTSMRLFTVGRHARARRFYEREGWIAVAEILDALDFGMPLVEYRRPISSSV
jgi:diamine N-acetyltransferase